MAEDVLAVEAGYGKDSERAGEPQLRRPSSASRLRIVTHIVEVGWVGASQLCTAAARFLILTLVARSSSPAIFGKFSFFVGLTLIVASMTELGMGRTLVRFVSQARGKSDIQLAQRYCASILQLKVLVSVIVLPVGLILVNRIRLSQPESLVGWSLAAGVLSSFGPLIASIFQAQGSFRNYFYSYLIDPIRFLIIFILFWDNAISLDRLLYIYLLTPLLLVILIPFTHMTDIFKAPSFSTYADLWSFGKWLFFITVLESLWQRLDVLMLGTFGNSVDVGIYSGGYMFMGVAALVAASIGTVVYPRMAEAHGRNDMASLAQHYLVSTNALALIGLPCIGGIWAVAPQLIGVVLGESYSAAAQLFGWFVVYGAFLLLQMNVGAVLFAVGKPQISFALNMFQVVLGIVANMLFIPRWHAQGAAAVLAICTVLTAILSWTAAARYIGTWPNFKVIAKCLFNTLIMFVAVKGIPLPLSGRSDLVVKVVLGATVYLILVKLMSKHENWSLRAGESAS